MSKKIAISKEVLEEFYVKEGFSTHKIAKEFDCDPSVIQKRLKEHKIKLRHPKKKIDIPTSELYNLYTNKGYSTQKIAKILGISSCSVYYKLIEKNIQTRHKNIIRITKQKLKHLYSRNHLSCAKIAKRYNCDTVTIFKKLKKYKIKTRDYSSAGITSLRKEFRGNDELKAYMIGFRLGDLNVKSTNNNSIVMIKSNTTKKEQFDLIKKIYGKYGHFKFTKRNNEYCIWCNLDKSFSFLTPKEDKIEEWILNNKKYFFPFLAGYSDAEGSFGIYNKMGKFRIGTYDKKILSQICDKLNSFSVVTKLHLEKKAMQGVNNNDFYRITICRKESLFKVIDMLFPYIKHKKRYRNMIAVRNNILERNKKQEDNIKI